MKIGGVQVFESAGQAFCQAEVEWRDGQTTLWYSVDKMFRDLLIGRSDAFLTALLIPAMESGEDIRVEGAVSQRLLYHLSGPIQQMLQLMIPSLYSVKIEADIIDKEAPPASGTATGFSGGIDSFCLLADHHYSDKPGRLPVTHLLFNDTGSHGHMNKRLFQERYEQLLPVTEQMGLPFVKVDSNLDSFYGKQAGFQRTHTIRNASVALLLQGGIGRFMYASTFKYSDLSVSKTYDISYSDPMLLPMFSTGRLDTLSIGGEYSRVEKTLRVAEVADAYDSLDVCVNRRAVPGRVNCSVCWKCLRTLATLEVAGCLDRFESIFNMDAYRQHRSAYFAKLLSSRDPLVKEVRDFARQRNFVFPVKSRLIHLSGFYPAVAGLKKLKHRKTSAV